MKLFMLIFYVMAVFGAGEFAGFLIAYGGAGGAILGAGVIFLAIKLIRDSVAKMFEEPKAPKVHTFR